MKQLNCPYLDFKHWKDKFSIEICSSEVSHQIFLSDSHWRFFIGPWKVHRRIEFLDEKKDYV